MNRLAGLFLAFAISLATIPTPVVAQDKSLTVFAAASMKNALDEIDVAYTAKTGVKIVVSYGPSSGLAKQLEQGAPADVFISADTDWMDYAIGKKSINEPSRINLLGNSIVLVAPKDFKNRQCEHRRRFRPRQARWRRQDRDWRCQIGAGREICQGGPGEAWLMASG